VVSSDAPTADRLCQKCCDKFTKETLRLSAKREKETAKREKKERMRRSTKRGSLRSDPYASGGDSLSPPVSPKMNKATQSGSPKSPGRNSPSSPARKKKERATKRGSIVSNPYN